MFPKAAQTHTLLGVTNPYNFAADGVDFLGTSGQGVDDVFRYSGSEDRCKIAESIVDWGHLFPTAPDTLVCFPYKSDDPFVFAEKCPHVIFNGNQPEYSSSVVTGLNGQKVRVVNVPAFDTSRTVVLVNTKTLETTPITFDAFEE
jgi:DNA polymerase delta subunit 2